MSARGALLAAQALVCAIGEPDAAVDMGHAVYAYDLGYGTVPVALARAVRKVIATAERDPKRWAVVRAISDAALEVDEERTRKAIAGGVS